MEGIKHKAKQKKIIELFPTLLLLISTSTGKGSIVAYNLKFGLFVAYLITLVAYTSEKYKPPS